MTLVEPITDEEFIGYLTAMLSNSPWGDPAAQLAVLDEHGEMPRPVETPGV